MQNGIPGIPKCPLKVVFSPAQVLRGPLAGITPGQGAQRENMGLPMTTNSITTKAFTVAISETIKLAWDLIRKGQRGAYEIDNSADYMEPVYTLFKRVEAWGLELEALADWMGQRLGVLDEALEHAAHAD
jgi:hypothetical protein